MAIKYLYSWLVLLGALAVADPGQASTHDFYKGKTIRFITAFSPGGEMQAVGVRSLILLCLHPSAMSRFEPSSLFTCRANRDAAVQRFKIRGEDLGSNLDFST